MSFINWLKWKIAPNEMGELKRWREEWKLHRRWFVSFSEISKVLDNIENKVYNVNLDIVVKSHDIANLHDSLIKNAIKSFNKTNIPNDGLYLTITNKGPNKIGFVKKIGGTNHITFVADETPHPIHFEQINKNTVFIPIHVDQVLKLTFTKGTVV